MLVTATNVTLKLDYRKPDGARQLRCASSRAYRSEQPVRPRIPHFPEMLIKSRVLAGVSPPSGCGSCARSFSPRDPDFASAFSWRESADRVWQLHAEL